MFKKPHEIRHAALSQIISTRVRHYKHLVYKERVRIVSTLLLLSQIASPLVTIVAYAAPVSSNQVGSATSLDPVANKASRLQAQGSSGVDQSTGAFTYSYPLALPATGP